MTDKMHFSKKKAYSEMERQSKIKLKAQKKTRLTKEQFVLMFGFERGIC